MERNDLKLPNREFKVYHINHNPLLAQGTVLKFKQGL